MEKLGKYSWLVLIQHCTYISSQCVLPSQGRSGVLALRMYSWKESFCIVCEWSLVLGARVLPFNSSVTGMAIVIMM